MPPNLFIPPVYRRRPLVCAVAVLLLVGTLVDHLRGGRQSDDYTRYHDRVFTVVNVLDGDTFDLDLADGRHATTRIRLWGVDTPEVAGSQASAMHYGVEASVFAKGTLAGRSVRIELSPTRTRDRYGRLLAYVYLLTGGESFNELLLENGYAYADGRFEHPLANRYQAAETRARRRGVGLWAKVKFDDLPAWRQRMEKAFESR
ncbi:MAG: thermonuclease family protein [Planctomycetota bacterium]